MAAEVEKKKVEVSKTNLKPSAKREKITSFISQQKSRQEFPPLVGNFIDKAKAEPLHLKNNAWQQWNSFVLKYALSRTDVRNCDTVFEVPTNSCFGKYSHCIRFIVKATRLTKKKLESGLPMTEPGTTNWNIGLQGKSPTCFVTSLCLLLMVSQWMMTSSLIHSSCKSLVIEEQI